MPFSTRTALLIVGVLFHVVYLWSIFDIYFRSPLVHGMTPHQVSLPSPAQRLVLFVADGLRADKIYEPFVNTTETLLGEQPREECLAPFLHDVIHTKGSWGVSHTHVPTESRPGHVALIAGFYEDVSAVTKGWKMNPVNFDSVFNQSRHTWSFGSPDILPMFAHGATNPEHVETFMYSHEDEDFGVDGSVLDTWVFKQVHALLDRAGRNQTLKTQLGQPQVVFFLHLLGLDTNGHAHRPYSSEYLNNIRSVDRGIQAIVERLESFYQHDGKTAYVFTADHGMNNQGAHGDGHPDNTRTPLIAWGAGVQGPKVESKPAQGHNDFSAPWGLLHLVRKDVEQADIAPLMASLIGIPYPMNSVGVLPLDYLDNSSEFKAKSALVNAMQILEQYRVKHDRMQTHRLFFKAFGPLSNATHRPTAWLPKIQKLIETHHYEEAEAQCLQLVELSLRGLHYYQTYDWLFLRSIVTLGYLGWIAYSLTFVLRYYVLGKSKAPTRAQFPLVHHGVMNGFAGVILLLLFGFLYKQDSPFMYYAYAVFPVYFWNEVLKEQGVFRAAVAYALDCSQGLKSTQDTGGPRWRWVLSGVLYLLTLELLVLSYFYRSVLSVGFVLLALRPWVDGRSITAPSRAWYIWVLACLAMAIFTVLPVEKREDARLILAGGLLIVISGLVALWYRDALFRLPADVSSTGVSRFSVYLLVTQLGLLIATGGLVWNTVGYLSTKQGLPLVNQALAWFLLLVSPTLPLLASLTSVQTHFHRLLTVYLALASPFLLLSISYEVLFYFCFGAVLFLALFLEQCRETPLPRTVSIQVDQQIYHPLAQHDLFTSGLFLFLTNVGFFGTGNIASISSFSLEAVYRLTTIFDPFLMGALLIFKILIPFFLLSAVLGIINRTKGLSPMAMFLVVLSTTDIMTLHFFYLVKDTGSWLEIGTTISHFSIASLFVLFIIVLYLISQLFTSGIVISSLRPVLQKKIA
ncbi:Glycosyl phosphatidyl inositol anchor synthesis [Dispira simplex]|nr:Glycosyl phosphatidyl inositol anchor synthesis [Dispira simplex]